MKLFRMIVPAVALLVPMACDQKSEVAKPPVPVDSTATTEPKELGDMTLGRDYVKNMLEENEQALATMREELELIRRELERSQATPDDERVKEVKKGMIEKLDRQESELRKLNTLAEEMRQIIGSDKN